MCKTFQIYLKSTRERQAQLHQITATLQDNTYKEKEISGANDRDWIVV